MKKIILFTFILSICVPYAHSAAAGDDPLFPNQFGTRKKHHQPWESDQTPSNAKLQCNNDLASPSAQTACANLQDYEDHDLFAPLQQTINLRIATVHATVKDFMAQYESAFREAVQRRSPGARVGPFTFTAQTDTLEDRDYEYTRLAIDYLDIPDDFKYEEYLLDQGYDVSISVEDAAGNKTTLVGSFRVKSDNDIMVTRRNDWITPQKITKLGEILDPGKQQVSVTLQTDHGTYFLGNDVDDQYVSLSNKDSAKRVVRLTLGRDMPRKVEHTELNINHTIQYVK